MSRIPVKNAEFFHRISVEGTIILVCLSDDEFFWEITGLSADLWRSIDGEKTWDEIMKNHQESSDLVVGEYANKCHEFLDELIEAKIVKIKSA